MSLSLVDFVVKMTLVEQFENHVERVFGLEDGLHPDEVGVLDRSHHCDFVEEV